jgi:hypothetical protein
VAQFSRIPIKSSLKLNLDVPFMTYFTLHTLNQYPSTGLRGTFYAVVMHRNDPLLSPKTVVDLVDARDLDKCHGTRESLLEHFQTACDLMPFERKDNQGWRIDYTMEYSSHVTPTVVWLKRNKETNCWETVDTGEGKTDNPAHVIPIHLPDSPGHAIFEKEFNEYVRFRARTSQSLPGRNSKMDLGLQRRCLELVNKDTAPVQNAREPVVSFN